MKAFAHALILAALAVLAPAPCTLADEPGIQFTGRGARRQAWDALQFKPFDAGQFGSLSDWSDGTPLSGAAIKNKPVLIVTWASWFRASHAGLKAAQDLASRHEPQGLVVLAVHHQRGFTEARQTLEDAKLTLRYAHDAKGEFYSALKAEGAGPDFFLIDRAGRLRFAGVARESLDAATAIVVKESFAEAARAQPPSSPGAPGTDPVGATPGAPGKIPAATYATVQWPKANPSPGASNFQGKAFPGKLGKAKYIGLVPDMNGKIVVLDFWATWCPPCREAIPHLEKIAKDFEKDVVVVGLSDEDEAVVKKFLAKGKHSYYQGIDPAGGMSTAMGIQGIPHVVVLSSDGVVRWQGNPHPKADLRDLQNTVAALVKVDPGVKARNGASDRK